MSFQCADRAQFASRTKGREILDLAPRTPSEKRCESLMAPTRRRPAPRSELTTRQRNGDCRREMRSISPHSRQAPSSGQPSKKSSFQLKHGNHQRPLKRTQITSEAYLRRDAGTGTARRSASTDPKGAGISSVNMVAGGITAVILSGDIPDQGELP